MRRLVVFALVVAMTSLGAPLGAFAQAPSTTQAGSISGTALDAGGRALAGQQVDLVQAGEIVQTTTTGSQGDWTFARLSPGDYVVRVTINGRVAGIQVSLAPGQALAGEMIVAPSAAAPSAAFIAGLGPLWGTLFVVGVIGAITATTIAVTGS